MLHFLSRWLGATGELEEAQWQVAVAVGILVEVVLVVFLGRVEAVKGQHLGDNGFEVALGLNSYTLLDNW